MSQKRITPSEYKKLSSKNKIKKITSDLRYPFKEGDTYYTVENGLLVCSCWDDTSKDLYDADPEKVYYCVNKSGLIEWVPQSGGNKKLCSFPPELYLRRA